VLILPLALFQLPQAISGSTTIMWDPSGRILTQTSADASRPDSTPKAKQYRHVGSELLTVFSDQFAPFDFALNLEGIDVHSHAGALILRLPIAQSKAPLQNQGRSRGSTLEEVQRCLADLRTSAGKALLFLHSIQVGKCAFPLTLCKCNLIQTL
jgi:hypothetical protein